MRIPLIAILLLSIPAAARAADEPAAWQPLFNGKDLSGWYTFLKGQGKDNDPAKIFQVHEGLIHIYKDAVEPTTQPFGYIATDKDFADCRIRFQYKWGIKRFGSRATKPRDSGFLYHVFGPDGEWGPGGKVWPTSVECQIQENDVGDVYAIGTSASTTADSATTSGKNPVYKDAKDNGVPYTTPNTGNDRIVRSEMLEKPGDWNTVEVVLQGDSAVHIVNGKVNMRVERITRPDPADSSKRAPLDRGRILFQAEGAEVMYRNIEYQPLASPAAKPAP